MDELLQQRAVSDLYLISALVAYGLKPQRIDRSVIRRQKFLFDVDTEIKVAVLEREVLTELMLTVNEIETYFLSDRLFFPGNFCKTLQDIRKNIHGYREDMERGRDY